MGRLRNIAAAVRRRVFFALAFGLVMSVAAEEGGRLLGNRALNAANASAGSMTLTSDAWQYPLSGRWVSKPGFEATLCVDQRTRPWNPRGCREVVSGSLDDEGSIVSLRKRSDMSIEGGIARVGARDHFNRQQSELFRLGKACNLWSLAYMHAKYPNDYNSRVEVRSVSSGFPFAAATRETYERTTEEFWMRRPSLQRVCVYSRTVTGLEQVAGDSILGGGVYRVWIQPIALIADVGCWTSAFLIMGAIARAMIRAARRRRGLCACCAYPVRGLGRCPECGNTNASCGRGALGLSYARQVIP
ncbi:MAG: hypothetical protein WC718_10420 [Phycisphaerales bacterium]|jgi:hypothetical protein